jgi:hypothetical protein
MPTVLESPISLLLKNCIKILEKTDPFRPISDIFLKKAGRYDIYYWDANNKFSKRTPKEIMDDLHTIAPPNLTLEDMMNLLFNLEQWNLLDAFFIVYPSLELSRYNLIRKAIIQDRESLQFTNDWLIAELKKHNIITNLSLVQSCYELAHTIRHPYIFERLKKSIHSHLYSLNFLWVNLNPQDRLSDRAENIFNDGLDLSENQESCSKKTFYCQLKKWNDLNPNTALYLWYDSALVTEKAYRNTARQM